jgi:predicted DNA-binding protein (MmcQ/YjbR family)
VRPATRRKLLDFALTLPGAYEDHPWGEDVAKVNKKVFVFFGIADNPASGMTVKLRDESHEHALSVPGAAPTGYGLGKSGWVTVPYAAPLDVCRDWIEESYRLVAPKRLQAELSSGRRRTRPARIPTRRAAPPG